MRIRSLALSVAVSLASVAIIHADTIVLKDGTILGGVVKQVKNGYEITNPTGKTTFVPTDNVKSIKLSNDGKTNEQSAKERLASLRRSVEADTQLDRIIERYKQFIEMNKNTDATDDAAKDLEQWQQRKDQDMVKVGAKWLTPKERDDYLLATAKLANEIADQIAAGDIANATKRVADGLEADPSNLSLAYLDGVLHVRRGRLNEAKRSFDIVFEQIPEHPPTLFNEAALATNFKRWPNAIPMFEKVMTLTPNHPEILNGVTEFLRLLPDANKRSAAFDRLMALYSQQEEMLGVTMAKQGLYRFGSGWANQATIDEMKKKIAEFEEKKKVVQTQLDGSLEKMRQLAADIDAVDRRLAEIERDRISFDPVTGRTAYLPRPSYYYDLAADRERYVRDLQTEKSKNDDLKKQVKDLESQAPKPPFAGKVVLIGEAGVPIVLPAGSEATPDTSGPTTAPAEVPLPVDLSPATQPSKRPPTPLLPEPQESPATMPSN